MSKKVPTQSLKEIRDRYHFGLGFFPPMYTREGYNPNAYKELGEEVQDIPKPNGNLVRIMQKGHPLDKLEIEESRFLPKTHPGELYFIRKDDGCLVALWGKDGQPPYQPVES